MRSTSREITSNQSAVHERLVEVVLRHQQQLFLKPVADHTRQAFDVVAARLLSASDAGLIMDSCCGTGYSSRQLAAEYPEHWVIGLDRSAHRLSKQSAESQNAMPENLLLVQADCVDFWRLAVEEGWQLQRHYLLYPNPYPKAAQLKKRWHGHPAFNDLIRLGGLLEVRSNWEIYIQEFALALETAGQKNTRQEAWNPASPLTLFERKYQQSSQALYRCVCQLS